MSILIEFKANIFSCSTEFLLLNADSKVDLVNSTSTPTAEASSEFAVVPLNTFIMNNNLEILKTLIELRADVCESNDENPVEE